MSVEAQLEEACNRWQELASAEKDAIQENDWPRLGCYQQAIEALQPQFTISLNQARAEWARLGAHGEALHSRFRARVSRLVELEQENSALLEQTRTETADRLKELQQSTRRLRRVRQSYTPTRGPDWSSFS
jgi:hypothetical protein